MKLLTEMSYDYGTLYEAEGDKKALFIEGIFLQADIKNRNGRVYPKHVMAKEVNRYMQEAVQRGNAFGELDHPATPKINPDRISHLITSLREEGSNFIGKAKILETPMGLIAKSIIEGGGKLAVSSRGTGTLRNVGGVMQVQEDFTLSTAADIVINPSAPNAYVDAIMEAPDWIYDHMTGEWLMQEAMNEIHNTKPSQLDEAKALHILDKFLSAFDTKRFVVESLMFKSPLDAEFKALGLDYLSAQSSGEVAGYWANPKGKGVLAQNLDRFLKSKGWKLVDSGGAGNDKWRKYESSVATPYRETNIVFTHDGVKVKLVHHSSHLDRS